MTCSFDIAHLIIKPELNKSTELCSSGRSAPQVLTFGLWTTLLMKTCNYEKYQVLISILSNLLAVLSNGQQLLTVSVSHLHAAVEDSETCTETKRNTCAKFDVLS